MIRVIGVCKGMLLAGGRARLRRDSLKLEWFAKVTPQISVVPVAGEIVQRKSSLKTIKLSRHS